MPRSLVFGNGNLTVALDNHLQIRDITYPYVGMETHTAQGSPHRIGVFTDGWFSWINDHRWKVETRYAKNTLVGNSTAQNEDMGVDLKFEDFVYTTHDIFLRKISIKNNTEREREIKMFFHHDFHLYGDKQQDTAQFEPELNAIVHYRRKRYFLTGGAWKNGKRGKINHGMDQFTVGKSGLHEKEGTFRDAEDGILSGNSIEQGSIDSTIGFSNTFAAGEEKVLYVWICAGKEYGGVSRNQQRIYQMGAEKIFNHTKHFWEQWIDRTHRDFYNLPEEIISLFQQSLLLIRAHTDNRGAVIASIDSDIMQTNRDNYNYMWPRDGALAMIALSDAGYNAPPERFFQFCEDVLTDQGYLLHKYNPDGSVGSSWLPKWRNGESQLPIQQDESALVLVALEQHYKNFLCVDTVQKHFNTLVMKIGHWLMNYVDKKTGLPLSSYDLWEQDRATSSYATSCTIAGLRAAATLSHATGHYESEKIFAKAEEKMKKAMLKHLYCAKQNSFLKSVLIQKGEIIAKDPTADASLAFVWKMGVLPVHDKRIINTMKKIEEKLFVSGTNHGLARFENDSYHFDYHFLNHKYFPGNPWMITTLWRAQYLIERAESEENLTEVMSILSCIGGCTNGSGMLPEQVHPETRKPLFISPLVWSHASYAYTVLQLLKKKESFKKSAQ